jgi:hypothetical protein
MKIQEFSGNFFLQLTSDHRLSVWHITLLMAIFYCGYEIPGGADIRITRRRLMDMTHIHSKSTYHKVLQELQQLGYIHYRPTYNPHEGSSIRLLIPDLAITSGDHPPKPGKGYL